MISVIPIHIIEKSIHVITHGNRHDERSKYLPSSNGQPFLVFDKTRERKLLETFISDHDDSDIDSVNKKTIDNIISNEDINSKVQKMSTFNYARSTLSAISTQWAKTLDLMISQVILSHMENCVGGSTPKAPGLLWVNVPNRSSMVDYCEFIVHELTHQMLFIDDLISNHFHPVAYKVQCSSSIRGTRRSAFAAFHSLAVTANVLNFRKSIGIVGMKNNITLHPNTPSMIAGAMSAIESIQDNQLKHKILTDRGVDIFKRIVSLIRLAE